MRQVTNLLKSFYDKLADTYDETTLSEEAKWIAPKETDKLITKYVDEGTLVLDLGVGTGQSIELAYEKGAEVVGIDLSPEMVDRAKSRFPKATFFVADLEDEWPEFDESFDVVVASGVLEFVSDLDGVFKKVSGVLRSGGLFCFTFEEYLKGHYLQGEREAELGKGLKDPIPEEYTFLVFRRTPTEVTELLGRHKLHAVMTKQFTAYYKSEGKHPVTYQVVLARKE